jgi:8-oxo-dGTP pyrophosphatase MutT (NUDIX family)
MISTFTQFISEGQEFVRLAGVAIIFENKLLLIHPTNSSWQKSVLGIPKGHLEAGEDPMQGALRELFEETGIRLDSSQLNPEVETVDLYQGQEKSGQLIYFVCQISDLSEIGLTSLRVDKSKLQLEEVDWAGFLSAKEAYPKINRSQLIILDRHLTLN